MNYCLKSSADDEGSYGCYKYTSMTVWSTCGQCTTSSPTSRPTPVPTASPTPLPTLPPNTLAPTPVPTTAAPNSSPYYMTEFRLINADTNTDVRALVDGETLILDELGFNSYNIQVVSSTSTWWCAWYINTKYYYFDYGKPFSLCGDSSGRYNNCRNYISTGTFSLAAVPYRFRTAYDPLWITITIRESARRELAPGENEPDGIVLATPQASSPMNVDETPVPVDQTSMTGGQTSIGIDQTRTDQVSMEQTAVDQMPLDQTSIEVNQNGGSVRFKAVANSYTFPNEPSMEGMEEDEYYCSAEDFPCKGDGMVYICMYSSYKGYQTLCVAEAKSDILSYYEDSYCGKCKGGLSALFGF